MRIIKDSNLLLIETFEDWEEVMNNVIELTFDLVCAPGAYFIIKDSNYLCMCTTSTGNFKYVWVSNPAPLGFCRVAIMNNTPEGAELCEIIKIDCL